VRIPVKHVDLSKVGYEGYWIEIPRSITEGWLYEMNTVATSDRPDIDKIRDSNLMVLETVTAWNLDDDNNRELPLVKLVKGRDKKIEVLSQIPLEVLTHVSGELTGQVSQVSEEVKDF
jgi:hypothetical protein